MLLLYCYFFFFKQKTAYEMRISDWSSDVCSSDLPPPIEYIRRSGGLFRDMMIHDLDMARWLLGAEPIEVFARGSALADPAIGEAGDVDTAMRSEERRVGKECVRTCRSRWSAFHLKTQQHNTNKTASK